MPAHPRALQDTHHRESGELVPLFTRWRLDPMPLYAAFAPHRHVSAKLRAFMDWVSGLVALHAPAMGRSNTGQEDSAA